MGGWKRVAGSIALIAATTACGNHAPPADPPSSTDTITSTTRTPRVVDESGRSAITFDPCLDLPDDVLVEAEFDPRSKRPSEYPMESYTFLGCSFKSTFSAFDDDRLSVLAGNVTLEEEWEKNAHISTHTNINGRDALFQLDPNNKNTCAITVRTEFGMVIFSRTRFPDDARSLPLNEWCADLDQAVALFEPHLDQ
ncbi:DUF3558 domain-containing protein [Rhodococcus sp. NPDC060086]|uniref:DUF3558 domain-containing protein n=1 Tax=Rhodococcus sp. NPDC060086 TaxID=3347055 RepID=UPI003659C0E6